MECSALSRAQADLWLVLSYGEIDSWLLKFHFTPQVVCCMDLARKNIAGAVWNEFSTLVLISFQVNCRQLRMPMSNNLYNL